MLVSRVAIVALVATAFGSSAALAECGAHKQSVEKETMSVMTDGESAQSPIPAGGLAEAEPTALEEAAMPQPRTAAPKSE